MTTILTIEDQPKIRENIQEILELEGFDVLTAENGRIGIQLAQEHIPDLILCDVMMPELDGYDVLVKLRQDPSTLKIPFIFLSAKATKADFRTGMSLGADDYLTKPFTPSELRSAVLIRLNKREMMMARYCYEINRIAGLPHQMGPTSPVVREAVTSIGTLVKVVQPTGILDVTNCIPLRREIIEATNTGGCNVLVDCQNLTFMDSSGLSALVLAAQKMREVNSQLSICSINEQIEMLFELSSMEDIFEIFASPTEFYNKYNLSSELAPRV
jgi:anti-anti-sigma factor